MQSDRKKQIDVARLKADVAAAGIEILSAQCAADRVRLHYAPEDIVAFGERSTLKKAITSLHSLCRFFALIEVQLKHAEEHSR
jgi:hypothetical protein